MWDFYCVFHLVVINLCMSQICLRISSHDIWIRVNEWTRCFWRVWVCCCCTLNADERFMMEVEQALVIIATQMQQQRMRKRSRKFKYFYYFCTVHFGSVQITKILWNQFCVLFRPRRIWQHEFDVNIENMQPDLGYWKDTFRMQKNNIRQKLPNLWAIFAEKSMHMRKSIPLNKRVAVALNWLANGGPKKHAGSQTWLGL